MKPTRPEDVFRAEKERAQSDRNSQHARLLAEAKAAFDKLMAEGQAARKSGRPRKHPLPPLKTSSARPPVKPLAPTPVKAPASTPAAVPVPAAKPATKPVGKMAKPARASKPAKAVSSATRARKAPKAAKPKKGKPSKKR